MLSANQLRDLMAKLRRDDYYKQNNLSACRLRSFKGESEVDYLARAPQFRGLPGTGAWNLLRRREHSMGPVGLVGARHATDPVPARMNRSTRPGGEQDEIAAAR
jgi:hypothetical protein